MSRPRRSVNVAIVGAGLGGIANAVNLARAGIRSFTVFECAAGPGGVWWHNTYPGCEVDIASLCYSYSFHLHDWSRTHVGQAEIQAYVEDVIDHFDVRRHIRFGTAVAEIRWDEADACWWVRTEQDEVLAFDVVISCVGFLSHANIPSWPGLDTFAGPVFHTSHYDHTVDLAGRRVAVVGTGSTACQLVPALADRVGELDLYQREPGWVLPKGVRDLDREERDRYLRQPWRRRWERYQLFRLYAKLDRAYDVNSAEQSQLRGRAERYIERVIDDPEVRKAVTPTYAFGCKRAVYASDFYPALNRENVHLIARAVTAVTPTGIVDSDGCEHPADVLILATGFQTTRYLATLPVYGPKGLRLQDIWGSEPRAFLGITVPGFPNFFITYGPNTNGGGSLIHQLERQSEVIARSVRRLARRPDRVVDTRPGVADWADRAVQRRIGKKLSALVTGCRSYYFSDSGRNVTQWPGTATAYWLATRLLPRRGLVFVHARREPQEIGTENTADSLTSPADGT